MTHNKIAKIFLMLPLIYCFLTISCGSKDTRTTQRNNVNDPYYNSQNFNRTSGFDINDSTPVVTVPTTPTEPAPLATEASPFGQTQVQPQTGIFSGRILNNMQSGKGLFGFGILGRNR
jgi:hypothetical protein